MLTRQRYDLDYPCSQVRFIDHDKCDVYTMGYVVWPCYSRNYWADNLASRRIIAGMSQAPSLASLQNIAW